MKIDWKKYVDQIYIVDYIGTDPEVTKHFNEELERVGIDRTDTSFITTFMNINTPLYEKLYSTFKGKFGGYSYAFDCTIGHYYCMKLAQANNYNRILILENDCIFFDDINYIKGVLDQMNNLYENNQVDLFCGNLGVINDNAKSVNYDDKTIKRYLYKTFSAGAAFNIYNQKAYSTVIKMIETDVYAVIDMYIQIYSYTDIQICYSSIPICVQKQWDIIMENLYEHYNMYAPSDKAIQNANDGRYKVKWIDGRNLHKLLYNVLEHYNLQDKYSDIYEDCKKYF